MHWGGIYDDDVPIAECGANGPGGLDIQPPSDLWTPHCMWCTVGLQHADAHVREHCGDPMCSSCCYGREVGDCRPRPFANGVSTVFGYGFQRFGWHRCRYRGQFPPDVQRFFDRRGWYWSQLVSVIIRFVGEVARRVSINISGQACNPMIGVLEYVNPSSCCNCCRRLFHRWFSGFGGCCFRCLFFQCFVYDGCLASPGRRVDDGAPLGGSFRLKW